MAAPRRSNKRKIAVRAYFDAVTNGVGVDEIPAPAKMDRMICELVSEGAL